MYVTGQPLIMLLSCAHAFTAVNKFNTLTPRQNGCHFADDIFICNFLNENH